jgi:signal transduction histidine kinase
MDPTSEEPLDSALLEAVLDHLDPILVEGHDGVPIFVSSAYVRLTGSPENGSPAHHPVGDEGERAELRAGGVAAHRRMAWHGGRVLRRDYVPVRSGSSVAHVWRYIDVTSEVRAEERRRASKDRLRDLSAHAEAAREEERRRLARTLHDELGQRMTSIRLELLSAIGLFRTTVTPPQVAIVDRLQAGAGLVDVAIAMLRQLTTSLRPPVLDHLGLVEAIRWEARIFESRTHIRCRVTARPSDLQLDAQRSIALYRILLEALTNVVRHADAGAVRIGLVRRRGVVIMKVEDNGRGITPDQIANPRTMGLLGMRERALVFGGDVRITGAPRGGTRVLAILPNGPEGDAAVRAARETEA